jgi:hypothetical protein
MILQIDQQILEQIHHWYDMSICNRHSRPYHKRVQLQEYHDKTIFSIHLSPSNLDRRILRKLGMGAFDALYICESHNVWYGLIATAEDRTTHKTIVDMLTSHIEPLTILTLVDI